MSKNKPTKAKREPQVKKGTQKTQKSKSHHGGQKQKSEGKVATPATTPLPSTTSGVCDHPVLGYKLRVLLYDLCNIAKDTSSLVRINTTTDEHYFSQPYFSPEQAACIKSSRVDVTISKFFNPAGVNTWEENDDNQDVTNNASPDFATSTLEGQPMDKAIRTLLDNFFEKRRASGDARPCGPHDLAPVYAALFGIQLAELKEERFLQRYRRTCLGDS